MNKVMKAAVLSAVLCFLIPSFATAAQRDAALIAIVGQFIGDGEWPIVTLNAPFTNSLGQPGFTGTANFGGGSEGFVWVNDAVVFRAGQVTTQTLTNFEHSMELADNADYIFSPAVNGNDSVWTQAGPLLIRGQQAPFYPGGTLITFASRPAMLPDGTAYWISGYDSGGNLTTLGRVLYKCADVDNPASIEKVLAAGDLIEGIPIATSSGLAFDFKVSNNGLHHIHRLTLATGNTANDDAVIVNNAIAAREGSPASGGTGNWQNFILVSINNNGDSIFTGDTNAIVAQDAFLAYNGSIVVQEGESVAGVSLADGSSVLAASINNQGVAAHVWQEGGSSNKHLFLSAVGIWDQSVLLLSTGDTIDTTGDSIADYTVTDLAVASNQPHLDLADDGRVLLRVSLESILSPGSPKDAIIAIPAPVSIELTMTVRKMEEGDECGSTCGTETSIDIIEGEAVEICYNVRNTGLFAVTRHTLNDSVLGNILNELPYDLVPGASAFLTQCTTPTETLNFEGEWEASFIPGGYSITATDSITVTVIPQAPSIELVMTVRKFEEGDVCGSTCGTETSIDIVAGEEVEICYEVRNTGNVAFTHHTLSDTILGVILNDFTYNLIPGSSAFLTMCHSPTETTTFTGEWEAFLSQGGESVSAIDAVTVNVLTEPGISWMTH